MPVCFYFTIEAVFLRFFYLFFFLRPHLNILIDFAGKQNPLPEPEAFDLPEDLQLDEGEGKDDDDGEENEENPFDIDTMKGKA